MERHKQIVFITYYGKTNKIRIYHVLRKDTEKSYLSRIMERHKQIVFITYYGKTHKNRIYHVLRKDTKKSY